MKNFNNSVVNTCLFDVANITCYEPKTCNLDSDTESLLKKCNQKEIKEISSQEGNEEIENQNDNKNDNSKNDLDQKDNKKYNKITNNDDESDSSFNIMNGIIPGFITGITIGILATFMIIKKNKSKRSKEPPSGSFRVLYHDDNSNDIHVEIYDNSDDANSENSNNNSTNSNNSNSSNQNNNSQNEISKQSTFYRDRVDNTFTGTFVVDEPPPPYVEFQ